MRQIFGMAIETILQCYIADEEMFPSEQRYAEGSLQGTMVKARQDGKAQVCTVSARLENHECLLGGTCHESG
jgi:hypothetical protein